jgi:hypothetical protein
MLRRYIATNVPVKIRGCHEYKGLIVLGEME